MINKSLKKFNWKSKIKSTFIFINNLLQLQVWVKANDHAAQLFINSDCIKNYIFSKFVKKAQIFMQKKKESYNLQNFNKIFMKYNNELINQETQLIHLKLEWHWKKLCLNVTKQSDSNIDLNISWLYMINSMIDWINETIAFLDTETTRLHSILKSSQSMKIFIMMSEEMREEFKEINDTQMLWSREIQSNHLKNLIIAIIFKEYQKYKILFKKESDQKTLLKHQSWNHKIKLINDKKLMKQFIYSLLIKKLDALQQYLKENMWKKFIKEL